MLQVVTDTKEKKALQERLQVLVKGVWGHTQVRQIGWQSSGAELPVRHSSEHWFVASVAGEEEGTYRYWNAFGDYQKKGNLHITVEINIPIDTNTRRVSGFFARDLETGITYLMHDGGIGGGREGIGKGAFLTWADLPQIEAQEAGREPRRGIIVAALEESTIDGALTQFVSRVSAFKRSVSEAG